MRKRIVRVEVDHQDGELVTIETNDGVTIEICSRALWRSGPGSSDSARLISAGGWIVVVSPRD